MNVGDVVRTVNLPNNEVYILGQFGVVSEIFEKDPGEILGFGVRGVLADEPDSMLSFRRDELEVADRSELIIQQATDRLVK